jgi:vitamin B12 transporter
MLRLFSTTFDKEVQHNVDMSVPYGEVTTGQTAIGGTLRYELARTEGAPFSLNALLGYSRRSIDFLDASRRVYDWFGNVVFERAENSGEITRRMLGFLAGGAIAFSRVLTTSGVDDERLTKPFTRAELLSHVRRTLDRPRLRTTAK